LFFSDLSSVGLKLVGGAPGAKTPAVTKSSCWRFSSSPRRPATSFSWSLSAYSI
jgi:hypothetical protein